MTDENQSEMRRKIALVFLDGTARNTQSGRGGSSSGKEQVFPAAIIDRQLILVDKQVTPVDQNALEICLLYALGAARAEIKNASPKPDPSPRVCFDALVKALGDLGLVVKGATETTSSRIANLTEALAGISLRYLDREQFKYFNAANLALQNGTAPAATGDILRDWWTSGSASGSATVTTWGMISEVDGQPTLTLLYLAFDRSVAPGASSVEGFNLTSSATTLVLNMSVYRAQESTLRARLGAAISRYIRHVTLQLTTAD